ncbi:hypothetical protein FB567DRAFT_586436 [Paraphoma chrysanthemicola]|uniref:Uncharacterized protein n=1 Tax=Paraphoma chrysanthemicola TaxID=798071 RepID=A0A8K0W3Y2_9PLEO|nr:hypothetical protein FB567DRAFT_586436 [Paraphoma chrysanthemicola]
MSSTQDGQSSSGPVPKPVPTLDSLPSELRRIIVSYLAPLSDELVPGCKKHLKNANVAHSCLREWAREYLFRDMPLNHVLVGMSSHLECFVANPENTELLKYIKHVRVQVPPGLRWEVGTDDPFGHHLDDQTSHRLHRHHGVSGYQLNQEQRQYNADYHRAMVEPFTDNRSWYRLLRAADASWGQIFRRLKSLEEISVGCCDIVDQPPPTYTHTFIRQHGRDIINQPYPKFVEDATVNVAWASVLVVKAAPASVRRLQVSMANMDNFNSFATVNRLLGLSYQGFYELSKDITRLSLTLSGIAGTHGSRDWHGETGSAFTARYWKSTLNKLANLQHLELQNDMSLNEDLMFSDMQMSDPKACILDWILPGLIVEQLRTLHLRHFLLDNATVETTFAGHWPLLEKLVFDEVLLMQREEEGINFRRNKIEHLLGKSWVDLCRALAESLPALRIILDRPTSNVNDVDDYRLHPTYLEQLSKLPQVHLIARGPYSQMVRSPNHDIQGVIEEPLLPSVPTATP